MEHAARNLILLKHSRWLMLGLLVAAFSLAMACGSGSDSDDSSDASDTSSPSESAPAAEPEDDLSEVSQTLKADQTFTVDDFTAAGWKQNKKYDDISTVPEATEVYFGFYNAKDIEVRIYASHDSAAAAGGTDAAEDIDQAFREGGQVGASNRGAGSRAVTKFKAFAIVGNSVILCELSLDVCVELAAALGG